MSKLPDQNRENDIKTKHWFREAYPGIRVYKSTYHHFQFPRHFHNYYTIQIVDEGVNRGFTDHHHYQLGPDSILIINPGEVHAGSSVHGDKLSFSVITIEEPALRALFIANRLHSSGDFVFNNQPINDVKLATKIRSFIELFRNKTSELSLHINLIECLIILSGYIVVGHSEDRQSPSLSYLDKAKDYIRANYNREISLAEIAAQCGVSEFHLVRQFREKFSLTPFEYLRNYRVECARPLLTKSESITQVALSVGFYDHSHFLKNFKRITGMLPKHIRKVS